MAWHRRAVASVTGLALTVGLLVVTGFDGGGGFAWLKFASFGTVASSFSVLPPQE